MAEYDGQGRKSRYGGGSMKADYITAEGKVA